MKYYKAQEKILKYWKEHCKDHVGYEEFDKEVFIHAGRIIAIHYQILIPKWSFEICGVGK